jgi:ketosteroid isomerase-like protein
MSEQTVGLTRRFIDAWNRRDIEAMIAFCDPGIEYHSVYAAVGGAVYHGHDELRGYHRDLQDAWGDETRLEPEAFFDLGDHTLSFFVGHGRGKHSGVEVDMPNAAAVMRWRDGLMVYLKAYAHREDALADLGVTEVELTPLGP